MMACDHDRTWDEHRGGEQSCAVNNRRRPEAIIAHRLPVRVHPSDITASVYDRLRNADIGKAFASNRRRKFTFRLEPLQGQEYSHCAARRRHGIWSAGIVGNGAFEVFRDMVRIYYNHWRSSSTDMRRASREHLALSMFSCFFSQCGRPVIVMLRPIASASSPIR